MCVLELSLAVTLVRKDNQRLVLCIPVLFTGSCKMVFPISYLAYIVDYLACSDIASSLFHTGACGK